MTESLVLLGVVKGAHGVKGEVKVKSFTENPRSLGSYGAVALDDGRRFEIIAVRAGKGAEIIMRFGGVTDRSAAESLAGQRIYVPRSALREPKPGEFYHVDLIGLRVENADGDRLGTVRAVHNFGAGDLIEVEFCDGSTEFIAFTDAGVPIVDIAAGRIVIERPRPGGDED